MSTPVLAVANGHGLARPSSAPLLAHARRPLRPASAAPAGVKFGVASTRGFASTLGSGGRTKPMAAGIGGDNGRARPASSGGGSEALLQRLSLTDPVAIDTTAQKEVEALLKDPVTPADLTPAQVARQRGTDAWLGRNYTLAAEYFGELVAMHAAGSSARIQGLRLRGAALLRARHFDEALADARAALAALEQPAADPSTDKLFFDLVATTYLLGGRLEDDARRVEGGLRVHAAP